MNERTTKRRENILSNIAIIPARSGSKGLKDKNIKELNGIPLIAYSIKCAIESRRFEKVFVSTDSEIYAQIAEKYGADAHFLRSEKNSTDQAGSWDVVKEVIECFEAEGMYFDNIMLLQPTSPLRTKEDIQNSFRLMEEKKANAVISVTEVDHSPLWCNTLSEDLLMDQFHNEKIVNTPRQELPTYYRINGAIYLLNKNELYNERLFKNKCYAYIMPNIRSLDIDTELDFKIAEYLFKENMFENSIKEQ